MTPEVKERIEQIRHGNVPEGYKRTKAGIYPEDWVELTMGDVYTERKEPGNENLPLLMVSIHSGVSDGEVDEADLPKKVKRIEDKSQYKRAASGDLVFNMMRAWQGAIGSVRTEGMVSPAYIVAEPNELVDPLFMDYYMKTPRMINAIHRQSYGVTDFRLRLYWDSFAPIRCILPPVAEQRRIGEILYTQDRVIEQKEQLLAEKQRQKKYLMQQLLDCQLRLGNCVKPWITTKSAFDFQKGEQLNGSKLSDGHSFPMYNGGMNYSGFSENWNCEDAIIISEGGNSCGYVNFIKGKFWAGGHCYYITRTVMEYNYLYQLLKHKEPHIMNMRVGSGLPNIQKHALKNMNLTYPSDRTEQKMIVDILRTSDREIDLLRQGLEREKQKKKALMQLLLAGIVRMNA